jgi:hypothetical protein
MFLCGFVSSFVGLGLCGLIGACLFEMFAGLLVIKLLSKLFLFVLDFVRVAGMIIM